MDQASSLSVCLRCLSELVSSTKLDTIVVGTLMVIVLTRIVYGTTYRYTRFITHDCQVRIREDEILTRTCSGKLLYHLLAQ